MENKYLDWKDVASTYYDKCLALTILFLLFTFMVFPNIETRVIKMKEKVMESIDVMQDVDQKIEQPQEAAKTIVNIEIVDEADVEAGEDVQVIESIEGTTQLEEAVVPPPTQEEGQTSRFVSYDDPPVPVRQPMPEMSAFAQKMGLSGQVTLEFEVLTDGSVGAVNVLKSLQPGPGGIDEECVAKMKKWRFQPAKMSGKAVACWATFTFSFTSKK